LLTSRDASCHYVSQVDLGFGFVALARWRLWQIAAIPVAFKIALSILARHPQRDAIDAANGRCTGVANSEIHVRGNTKGLAKASVG
jgi:hypothetical protein